MDKSMIEKYKEEMLQMHNRRAVRSAPPSNTVTAPPPSPASVPDGGVNDGRLIATVTTLRSLYPIENAQVTVFTGDTDNMQVAARGTTDESGRTEAFLLEAPAKGLSMDSANKIRPYALYNMLVKAEGYVDNIHLNIPVFSGTTSLQQSNMTLLETAGENKGPLIFDEAQQFNL